jgi:hypothetical protein
MLMLKYGANSNAWQAGYQTGVDSRQVLTGGKSPWVWNVEYQRYYNSVTQEWEEL